jgi:hypothetical protein
MKQRRKFSMLENFQNLQDAVDKLMLCLGRDSGSSERQVREDWVEIHGAIHDLGDCLAPI